jgi:hypothetical protein
LEIARTLLEMEIGNKQRLIVRDIEGARDIRYEFNPAQPRPCGRGLGAPCLPRP